MFREMQTLTFGVKKRGNISIISIFHFKTLYFYHNGLQTSPPRIFQLGSEEKQGVRCSRSCCSPSSARMSALAEIVEDKFPHGRISFPSKLNAGLFFNPSIFEKRQFQGCPCCCHVSKECSHFPISQLTWEFEAILSFPGTSRLFPKYPEWTQLTSKGCPGGNNHFKPGFCTFVLIPVWWLWDLPFI